ncbi:hypothetical protein BDR26DRAFT_801674 [Obelidium mucronatum]|nr:hypothetical protein BDR26DRAFT_801674 [Obelidium mucronatum]
MNKYLPLHLIPDFSEVACHLPVFVALAAVTFDPVWTNAQWQTLCSQLSVLQITCFLPFFCASFFYFGTSAVFFAIDITQSFQNYKIQTKKHPPTLASYSKATQLVLFNFIAINLPLSYANYLHLNQEDKLATQVLGPLPSPLTIVRDLAASALLFEFSFYWFHRLFHYPPLYKLIHKKHHEYTAPMGISAIYAHPIDHLLTNMVSMVLGPLFCKMHVFTLCLWSTIAVITTVCTHSGYVLPGSPNAASHDYHHYAFNSNFGVLGVFDWLHGTNKGSAEYEAGVRKRISRS